VVQVQLMISNSVHADEQQ